MVDMSAIATALTSLKAAKDIAESMIGLRDGAAFQSKLIEFQSKIIDANNAAFAAQDERSALLERIHALEAKVAGFETWNTETQRYELKDIGKGSLAYAVKESMRGTEPPHSICPACFEHQRKSILQPGDERAYLIVKCPACKTRLTVGTASFCV